MSLHPSQFQHYLDSYNRANSSSVGLAIAAFALLIGGAVVRIAPLKTALFGGAIAVATLAGQARKIAIRSERLIDDIDTIAHSQFQNHLWEAMKPGSKFEPVPQETPETVPDFPKYDLAEVGNAHHTMIVGPTGSGKSVLVQWLVNRYFSGADVQVYDSDCEPGDWPGLPVIGRGGDFISISGAMVEDLKLLDRRCDMRGRGSAIGPETVRVCEEFPAVSSELQEMIEGRKSSSAAHWLKRIARRGRKYKIKLILVTQETSVAAMGIEGEGSVRRAFTIIYLGSAAIEQAERLKDKPLSRAYVMALQQMSRPCLVDHKGRYFVCEIPDLKLPHTSAPLPAPSHPEVTSGPTSDPRKLLESAWLNSPEFVDSHAEVASDGALFYAITALLAQGKSKSWIVENVLNCKGRRFQDGMKRLEDLLRENNS